MSNRSYIPAGYEGKNPVDYFEENQDSYSSDEDDVDIVVYPLTKRSTETRNGEDSLKKDEPVGDETDINEEADKLDTGEDNCYHQNDSNSQDFNKEQSDQDRDWDGWDDDGDTNKENGPRTLSSHALLCQDIKDAIKNNDFEAFRKLFEESENLPIDIEIDLETPLLIACSFGRPDFVRFCLENGADPKHSKDWSTPLSRVINSSHADEQDSIKCARLLIEAGANIKSNDSYELAPLLSSCNNGKFQLTVALAELGADILEKDSNGWTALHYAATSGNAQLVRYLLDNGLKVNDYTDSGWTPGDLAIDNGHKQIGQLLEQMRVTNGYDHLRVSENSNMYMDEMEHFLSSLMLTHLHKSFSENNIKLRDLFLLSEQDFEKLGVAYGDQVRIADGIRKHYNSAWNPSKVSLFKSKTQLGTADVECIIRKIGRQVILLESKAEYLRDRLRNDPEMVNRAKDQVLIDSLIDANHSSIGSCEELLRTLRDFAKDLDIFSKPSIEGEVQQSKLRKAFNIISPTFAFIPLAILGALYLRYKFL